jgi:hypothetical protein
MSKPALFKEALKKPSRHSQGTLRRKLRLRLAPQSNPPRRAHHSNKAVGVKSDGPKKIS